jgi:hypothetical protein
MKFLLCVLLLAPSTAGAVQQREPVLKQKLDLAPFVGRPGGRAELVPVLAGEQVLVSSTLRLFAFDAHTA